jgi:cytochrome c-type biogenesis protein CcmH/NrfG
MQRSTRAALSGAAVVGLAAGMLAIGTAAGTPPPTAEPAASSASLSLGTQAVTDLQRELDQVPGKWPAWSSLGLAYVEQARVTADPTLYGKAEGAFRRSLELRPDDNDAALAGQATLAAARHDFAGACVTNIEGGPMR